jgi:hypothetical protein
MFCCRERVRSRLDIVNAHAEELEFLFLSVSSAIKSLLDPFVFLFPAYPAPRRPVYIT